MTNRILILMFFASSLLSGTAFAQNKAEQTIGNGAWLQNCSVMNEDDYVKGLIMIEGQEFDHVIFAYEDDACSKIYLIFKMGYQIQSMNPASPNSYQMKALVDKVSYTSLTDEVTGALNMIGYCGFRNWKTDEEKIVTGRTCDDFQAPAQGTAEEFVLQQPNSLTLFLNTDSSAYFKLSP